MEDILLGVDYGKTNTGLAFGRAGLVSPLKIVPSKDTNVTVAEINRIVVTNKVTKIIFGLPLNVEGKETKQSLEVRRFVKFLKIRLKKPVEFVSEFNTSQEALEGAIRSGISRKRRQTNDHLSAALILKRYYNEHGPEKPEND